MLFYLAIYHSIFQYYICNFDNAQLDFLRIIVDTQRIVVVDVVVVVVVTTAAV